MTIIGTKVTGGIPESVDGIMLSSRRGDIGSSESAGRWMSWLASQADVTELEFGKRIARKHQVYMIELTPGALTASVAETRAELMTVTVQFALPPSGFWEAYTEALLKDPVAIACLFAGREPEDLETTIEAVGGELPPAGVDEVKCTCGVTFCRHVVAAHCALVERLDDSPWLSLELIGRSRRQLCNVVREHWGDDPIPEEHERQSRIEDDSVAFYGTTPPKDASLTALPPFDAVERLGVPAFFPVDERNVKRTIEKLYHD